MSRRLRKLAAFVWLAGMAGLFVFWLAVVPGSWESLGGMACTAAVVFGGWWAWTTLTEG
jgi:hypothetical protein